MQLFLRTRNGACEGKATFEKGVFTVLKGSRISEKISTFKGTDSIKKHRASHRIVDGILQENIVFNSPSTAANFVTGASTNGLKAWKDKSGVALKELMK